MIWEVLVKLDKCNVNDFNTNIHDIGDFEKFISSGLLHISNVCICLTRTQKNNRTNKLEVVYPIVCFLFMSRSAISIPPR